MHDTTSHPEPATAPGPGPAKEVIARLARLLWEKAGCPEGYDLEFWLLAETALRETNRPPDHEAKF